MRKIIHLYKRSAATDIEAFHSSIFDSARSDPAIPGLSSYMQSHTLVQGYRKGELLFDAVDEFSFSEEACADYFAESKLYKSICRRRQGFIDHARSLVICVDVHRVKDTPIPANAVKNIEFVNRRPGMELGSFRRYWREVHGPLGASIPSILRYEQNHLTLGSYRHSSTPRFDGLAITWFESTAAMREGAATPQYAETRKDEGNFLPDGHLPIIIVREVLDR